MSWRWWPSNHPDKNLPYKHQHLGSVLEVDRHTAFRIKGKVGANVLLIKWPCYLLFFITCLGYCTLIFSANLICVMTWRPFNFELVHHRQAFQSPYQSPFKSAVNNTVLPGRDAGSLGMNGFIGILRLMSIISVFLLLSLILYSFCLFSQVDVCVGDVLIYVYLTLFAVES